MRHGKYLLATTLLLNLTSVNAQAGYLTTETIGGVNLVYDSGNNTTWTQDANLLGTLEGAYQSSSYYDIVAAIIDANSGIIHDTPNSKDNGSYVLTSSDFGHGGSVTWWGAQAFVHYLDIQNYGGSNKWSLPISNAVVGFENGSQLGELFYNELGGTPYSPIQAGPFSNTVPYAYWTGTETALDPAYVWIFNTYYGFQGYGGDKGLQFYAWPVNPDNIAASALPEPESIWLLGSGILGLLGLKKHRKNRQQTTIY